MHDADVSVRVLPAGQNGPAAPVPDVQTRLGASR